jgi:bifunctional non-homologous end joining protein LigD
MAGQDGASRVPAWVEPMLAKADGGRLRSGPEWAYEYKLDGYRACMQIVPDGTTVLTSRNGIDFTREFAHLAGALAPALDSQPAVPDGEIVVYNDAGQIDFGLLQERRGRYQTHRSSPRRDEPFDDVPVRLIAFDLLQLDTKSLLRSRLRNAVAYSQGWQCRPLPAVRTAPFAPLIPAAIWHTGTRT